LLDRLHQVQQKEYSLYSKTSSKNLVPGGKEPVDFVTYVVSVHVQRANSLNELGKDLKVIFF
jgi:hypothetical protein